MAQGGGSAHYEISHAEATAGLNVRFIPIENVCEK
jgi:hypothetical protein